MRLYLLPISTRRTLIYAKQALPPPGTPSQKTIVDKATAKAASLWTSWEAKETGWQKKVVTYGNTLLKRIPYEEWGLKSIPPLSKLQLERQNESADKGRYGTAELVKKVDVEFPPSLIRQAEVLGVVKKLGTERQAFHKSRIVYCVLGMPLTIPVGILPVIPNLPFFYLLYRAWSHYRALSGSKHLIHLHTSSHLTPAPSTLLDKLYARDSAALQTQGGHMDPVRPGIDAEAAVQAEHDEKMVLTEQDCVPIAQALGIPGLEMELERAVWQVGRALEEERKVEKEEGRRALETEKKKDE